MKTKYFDWFLRFLIISLTLITCKKEDNTSLPIVKTYSPFYISSTSVTLGFNVESDGGSTITDCGIYIGTAQDPETSGTQLHIASDTGIFAGRIIRLLPSTQYFYKAYAKNAKGEGLGEQVDFTTPGTITDYDNNVYETVKIGSQLWMAKNLRTTHYLNGDLIGTTSPSTLDISGESSPRYQWAYNGDENNVSAYGRLYTWYAVTDSRKVCPSGWHVSTDTEWTTLINYLGGGDVAGGKLKETGTSHWQSPNAGATNESCFTALPGGTRSMDGTFYYIRESTYWWSSTEFNTNEAWARYNNIDDYVGRYQFNKLYGNSVRCVKD